MLKKLYLSIPVLLTFCFFSILVFCLIAYCFSTDFNVTFDWVQIHTFGFIFLITLPSILVWLLSIMTLNKKGYIEKYFSSTLYSAYSTFILAMTIGLISTLIFIIYHNGPHTPEKSIEWVQAFPERFALSSFLLALLTLGLISLIGEVYLSCGIALVTFYILSLVNYYKKIYRNEPLFPNDFIQIGQIKEVIPMIRDSISIPMTITIIIIMIAFIFMWYLLPKIKLPLLIRMIILLPTIFLLKSFLLYEDTFAEQYYKKYASIIPWSQQKNYYYNGPIIGIISNIKDNIVIKPASYSKIQMENAIQHANNLKAEFTYQEEIVNPNIIFIMNETFWDPTKLNLTFSEDPFKNTRAFMKKYPSGSILSPTFGGETANVEFEALTSFSMHFFNPGGLPYQNILSKKEIPSFVSYMNQLGYDTESMHPNTGTLYMRQDVYPNLGFKTSKFIADMTHTEKDNREYVSDESVFNEIIDTIKQSEPPAFVHAVTIANHLPYRKDKYNREETIEVTGTRLSAEMKQEIEVYVEGIKRSDEALKRLEKAIQQLDEPTLIVFWGDHLPSLGLSLQAYIETGFGDEESQQTEKKFYETPLLFISNFELNMKKKVGTISPIYIAPTIVEALHFKGTLFYDYLIEMKEKVPAFRNQIYVNPGGQSVHSTSSLSEETKSFLNDYHLFEFDILSGKQYSKENLYK